MLLELLKTYKKSNIYTLWCLKSNKSSVHLNGASISKTFSEQIRWLNGKVLDWYTLFFLFQISFFTINLMSKIVVRCKIKKFRGTFSLTSVKENGRLLYCDIAIWVEKETLFLTPFCISDWSFKLFWSIWSSQEKILEILVMSAPKFSSKMLRNLKELSFCRKV